MAYTAREGTAAQSLYVRSVESFDAVAIPDSDGAMAPFFSPDGESVGFFAGGKLKRAAVTGGAVFEIADAPNPFGGSWGEDGSIIFVPGLNSGLVRMPASGGEVGLLTTPDNAEGGYAHTWPQILPGGHHVLFTIWGGDTQTAVLSLDTGQWQIILTNAGGGRFAEGGHLLYGRQHALRAVPFDVARLEVTGTPVSVVDEVYSPSSAHGRDSFALSRNGTLAYSPANITHRTLVWVDREGRETPVSNRQAEYYAPGISPDGSRVVYQQGQEIWVLDLERDARTRLTAERESFAPLWHPDGEKVIFASNRTGVWNLFSVHAGGTGQPEVLLEAEANHFPQSVALASGTLAFVEMSPDAGYNIWTLPPEGEPGRTRGESSLELYGHCHHLVTVPKEELFSITGPNGLGSTACRDRELVAGAGIGLNVDLVSARVVRSIGQETAVRRKLGRHLVERSRHLFDGGSEDGVLLPDELRDLSRRGAVPHDPTRPGRHSRSDPDRAELVPGARAARTHGSLEPWCWIPDRISRVFLFRWRRFWSSESKCRMLSRRLTKTGSSTETSSLEIRSKCWIGLAKLAGSGASGGTEAPTAVRDEQHLTSPGAAAVMLAVAFGLTKTRQQRSAKGNHSPTSSGRAGPPAGVAPIGQETT